jgi:hypothetical protein
MVATAAAAACQRLEGGLTAVCAVWCVAAEQGMQHSQYLWLTARVEVQKLLQYLLSEPCRSCSYITSLGPDLATAVPELGDQLLKMASACRGHRVEKCM